MTGLYDAMCVAAAHHPCVDEDEGSSELWYSADEVRAGAGGEAGAAVLAHLDGVLEEPAAGGGGGEGGE